MKSSPSAYRSESTGNASSSRSSIVNVVSSGIEGSGRLDKPSKGSVSATVCGSGSSKSASAAGNSSTSSANGGADGTASASSRFASGASLFAQASGFSTALSGIRSSKAVGADWLCAATEFETVSNPAATIKANARGCIVRNLITIRQNHALRQDQCAPQHVLPRP